MKEKIRFEYNLEVEDFIQKKDYWMFQKNNDDYYIVKVQRSQEELNDLISLYQELLAKGCYVHFIVPTIMGSFYFTYEDKIYVLLIVKNANFEYSLLDMLKKWDKMPVSLQNSHLNRFQWENLWSAKIDYYEYQIKELGKGKSVVINTFGYFVGLCENAISYVHHVNSQFPTIYGNVVLSHKRVHYPNYSLSYDCPLQFIFDLEVRDVAEYLKMESLNNLDYALIDLETYLKVRKLDLFSLGMLYGRLLYPSYYFDLYEEVMNYDADEDCLLNIMEKTPQIEEFLRKSYTIISNYGAIEPVYWLMNSSSL